MSAAPRFGRLGVRLLLFAGALVAGAITLQNLGATEAARREVRAELRRQGIHGARIERIDRSEGFCGRRPIVFRWEASGARGKACARRATPTRVRITVDR